MLFFGRRYQRLQVQPWTISIALSQHEASRRSICATVIDTAPSSDSNGSLSEMSCEVCGACQGQPGVGRGLIHLSVSLLRSANQPTAVELQRFKSLYHPSHWPSMPWLGPHQNPWTDQLIARAVAPITMVEEVCTDDRKQPHGCFAPLQV